MRVITVYHAELDDMQADAGLAALFAGGPDATPFDRGDWLRLMAEECLVPARCFVAVARRGDAIAALPLCRTDAGLSALANWYSFIARPRWNDAAAAPDLIAAIMRDLAPIGAMTFAPLPPREATILHQAARRAGWIGWLSPADVNHVTYPGELDFATWWAARPGSLRETVRRKARKSGVSLRITYDFTAADWDSYAAIYALSWKPAEGHPAFLRRFALGESAAGRLRLGLATLDGAPVAAQLWTVEAGTAFIHKLAHDARAAAHSPGTLLSHAMFAHVIDRDRVATIDFGTGDDGYKRDWMDQVRVRYRLEAYHPTALRHWPALGRLLARRMLRARAFADVSLLAREPGGMARPDDGSHHAEQGNSGAR